MKRVALLALALVLVPPSVESRMQSDAAWVFRQGKDVQVRLLQRPCENVAILAGVPPAEAEVLQEGVFIDRKEVIRFCYAVIEDDDIKHVVIVKESGEMGLINANRFRQEIAV